MKFHGFPGNSRNFPTFSGKNPGNSRKFPEFPGIFREIPGIFRKIPGIFRKFQETGQKRHRSLYLALQGWPCWGSLPCLSCPAQLRQGSHRSPGCAAASQKGARRRRRAAPSQMRRRRRADAVAEVRRFGVAQPSSEPLGNLVTW